MQMQHIYQPVMIKTLLESGGKAPVRKIAKTFLQHDESQIEYYQEITRNMPGRILRKHGIVKYESENFHLNTKRLTASQRSELISLCNKKIAKYAETRGKTIWQHRARDVRAVPGSLRYRVLTAAKYRCELCGINAKEKALDVDHIIPRNKGGKTVFENLQTLCYTCNSQKRDLDITDFRAWRSFYDKREQNCLFCNLKPTDLVIENTLAFAFFDNYPVSKGHSLIIPRRHVSSFFELASAEQTAILKLLAQMKQKILEQEKSVTGFNVGVNDGEDAGQSVFHCHVHLIPRRKGDVDNPKGGVRHVVPGKG